MLNAKTFVETGTLLGNTAYWAGAHFERVISIEADMKLYQGARTRLAPLSNVHLYYGKSQHLLAPLMKGLDRPAIVWLDAHWSGPGTAGEELECPLLDEIVGV